MSSRLKLALLTSCLTVAGLVVAAPAAAAPANDGIAQANAVDLSGDTATASFPSVNTAGATADDSSADGALSGGGNAQNTVWFKLRPAPGRVTVTVHSGDIPNVVAGVVTTQTPDASLNGTTDDFELISNAAVDNTDASNQHQTRSVTPAVNELASFSFTADAAYVADAQHDYYLGVGGIDTATPTSGTISLQIDYTRAPDNDDITGAEPLSTHTTTYTGDTTSATPELDSSGTATGPSPGQPAMFSVWYSFTAPRNGLAVLDTSRTSYPMAFEVCQSSAPSAADCARHDIQDWTKIASTAATVDVLSHQTYYFFIDGQRVDGRNGSGPYELTFHFHPAPANDDVSTPKVLKPSSTVRVSGTTVGAGNVVLGHHPPASTTSEGSHGLRFNGGARHTVWYRYTSPKSRTAVVVTSGPLDTDVEAFTGKLASHFTDTKAGNDDYAGAFAYSRFPLHMHRGTTYTIGVDGSRHAQYAQNSFALTVGVAPANDALRDARFLAKRHGTRRLKHKKVSAAAGKVRGSTQFATLQAHEAGFARQAGADVWYTFVAPKSGKYTFRESLAGGPSLAAYSGPTKHGLGVKLVKRAKRGSAHRPAAVTVKAKAGQTFKIAVGGTLGILGRYTLRWKRG